MKSAKQVVASVVLKEGIRYVEKNPMENLDKLVSWGERLATKDNHLDYANSLRNIIHDPDSHWHTYIKRIFTEYSPQVRTKFLVNFLVNSGLVGIPTHEAMAEKYDCNVPWAILMDPTAACNLKCIGCWAAEYAKTASLDYELMDRVIREGKELGIYMYIFSGGEPLLRWKDLSRLAREHNDCMFLAFTNATLVNERMAGQMAQAGNFALAISVEGFEEETDLRRGRGTYQKVINAMQTLQEAGVPFGFSTCYHSRNTHVVGSEEYIDEMISRGCLFGWYFTYVPLGRDADLDLLASSEQRAFMYERVRRFRNSKPIFLLDFWNDGEYSGGCIAGGRKYFHINANGDVEPCAFIHYSNVNIKDVRLIEALRSPLFQQYRLNQPFNRNHLRPCPLMDNPHKLREMVAVSQAVSTQPRDRESVEQLTDKCLSSARHWAQKADPIWEASHKDSCCPV